MLGDTRQLSEEEGSHTTTNLYLIYSSDKTDGCRKMSTVKLQSENMVQFETDEQTRLARFESMKKTAPGSRTAKVSRNKKLFVVHKDLQKQCDKQVKRHEYDARLVSLDIQRQQTFYLQKQERLKQQQLKYHAQSQRTHRDLESNRDKHAHRKLLSQQKLDTPAKTSDTDLIRAIRRMSMPKAMKEKLQLQTYTTRIDSDLDL